MAAGDRLTGIGAATVLAALHANRRRTARHHQPGDPIPTPTEAQRTLISELRGIATPDRIIAVDRTLRYLANQASVTGVLPEVHTLTSGDVVVLYTDGLDERRGEPIDLGLNHLAEIVGRAVEPITAGSLIESLAPHGAEDDTCAVVLTYRP